MKIILHYKILPILLLSFTIGVSGQNTQEIELLTKSYIEQSANRFNLNSDDIKEWVITSEHESQISGVNHVYCIQKHNGIEIYNATLNLHIIDENKVLASQNNFIRDMNRKAEASNSTPNLTAISALIAASKQLGISSTKPINVIEVATEPNLKQVISAEGVSSAPIPAKLMYYLDSTDQLVLVWDLSINEFNGENWWSLKIDAVTGEILDKFNWVVQCSFDDHNHSKENHISSSEEKESTTLATNFIGGYNVYPFPIESPNHGNRSVVFNPNDPIASPYGWHSADGIPGSEYLITRGNNVYAYDDDDNNNSPGFSPNGGSNLYFNFPINTTYSSADQSEAAAITNLFYWNNIAHDIWYQYGFDEASGNFQEYNYLNSGAGSDSVNAEAQDGGGNCNANFGTPPDGSNPRMQMYTCGQRDGDLDNLVIIHEYGHGISRRLVGGRLNSNALSGQEQMGEGWSDWFGLMMTIESAVLGTDFRTVGTWLRGQNAGGPGFRTWPYSTDMADSQYTYDHIKTLAVPHGVGSVWTAMLWELTWELIYEHGFDTDLYNGTGGNNIAMQLVIEGLKLTPNNPGFVDARDAILQADAALYGGANRCFIWNAFAKRGLGVSASQGSSASRSDGVEAFDVPSGCEKVCYQTAGFYGTENSGTYRLHERSDQISSYMVINSGANIIYSAGNKIVLSNSSIGGSGISFHAKAGSRFLAKIEGCTSNSSAKSSSNDYKISDYETIEINNYTSNEEKILPETETIKLYPNPTSGIITIESLKDIAYWELSNTYGQTLNKEFVSTEHPKKVELNLSSLATGVYFIKTTLVDGKIVTKQLIKR